MSIHVTCILMLYIALHSVCCVLSVHTCTFHTTVVPLLRDHPVVHTKVVFEKGWSFIRGRKQCKPKHVSSGIVVLNVRWSLIRVVSQEGDYRTKTKNATI